MVKEEFGDLVSKRNQNDSDVFPFYFIAGKIKVCKLKPVNYKQFIIFMVEFNLSFHGMPTFEDIMVCCLLGSSIEFLNNGKFS